MPTLEDTLLAALVQAQSYLDSYDTSRPSRVQAETRRIVAAALAEASQAARLRAETTLALRTASRGVECAAGCGSVILGLPGVAPEDMVCRSCAS